MKALIRKELALYFGNLSGYLISCLFLLITGLFLWIIPGHWNVFTAGYANLDGLFELAPWLYLFLIPAVAMRLFTDEYRQGTMELLMTSPLRSSQIVLAKYLAGFVVILLSLLPTLVYYYSVAAMALPRGNVDTGAIIGSYIGLFLLAAVYLSIALLASSLTENQIVAFLWAMVGAYVIYAGFDFMAIIFKGDFAQYLSQASIASHYDALSKGVITFADLLYFLSVTIFFLYLTKLRIER